MVLPASRTRSAASRPAAPSKRSAPRSRIAARRAASVAPQSQAPRRLPSLPRHRLPSPPRAGPRCRRGSAGFRIGFAVRSSARFKAQHAASRRAPAAALGDGALKRSARAGVGQIEALRVLPLGAEHVVRQRRCAGCGAPPRRRRLRDRIGDQVFDGHRVVHERMHEGRVGAVLQKPPHEIGEQRLVRADGRIDAAGPAQVLRRRPHGRTALSPMPCRH